MKRFFFYPYNFIPILIASSIVSGRFLPLVSGMKKVSNPARVTKLPIIKRGNGFQIVAKDSIKSPKNPPKPPIAEPIPTVVLLMGVGKSSAVIVNKILIAAETDRIPSCTVSYK